MNILGNPWTTSGYGTHTHYCAKALIKAGVDLGIQVPGGFNILPGMEKDLLEACKKVHSNAFTEMIVFPELWRFKLADRLKLVGYLVFEGDKIPLTWEKACNEEEILEIWCPSKHTKDAILNAEVNKDVRVIPHGFSEEIFKPSLENNRGDGDRNFRFLFVGGWARGILDRKGVHHLIAAFKSEFRRDEKVELILKINTSYGGNSVDFINSMKLPDGASVHLILDMLHPNRLADLYRSSDVFVCTSRAEAFNMPVLEAMACGNYIITTTFGGMSDYVPKWNKFVSGKLVPASKFTPELYYERANWLDCDMDELKSHLRWCFENQQKVKYGGKKNAKSSLKWTWDNVAQKIIERLNTLS